jgi:hypothetical protein
MSPPPLPIPSGQPDLPSWAVPLYWLLAGIGTVIAALIGLFGVLYSQRAPLQAALNGAFSALTKELQEERAQLIARISELERENGELALHILEKDGEIRGLKQWRDSRDRLEMKSTIPDGT